MSVIQNGILKTSESQIESYFNYQVKRFEGFCFKISSPSMRGLPDRLYLIRGQVYFIELKTTSGHLSLEQQVIKKKIEEADGTYVVLTSISDIEKFFKRLKIRFFGCSA